MLASCSSGAQRSTPPVADLACSLASVALAEVVSAGTDAQTSPLPYPLHQHRQLQGRRPLPGHTAVHARRGGRRRHRRRPPVRARRDRRRRPARWRLPERVLRRVCRRKVGQGRRASARSFPCPKRLLLRSNGLTSAPAPPPVPDPAQDHPAQERGRPDRPGSDGPDPAARVVRRQEGRRHPGPRGRGRRRPQPVPDCEPPRRDRHWHREHAREGRARKAQRRRGRRRRRRRRGTQEGGRPPDGRPRRARSVLLFARWDHSSFVRQGADLRLPLRAAIYDGVGKATWEGNWPLLRRQGTLVTCASTPRARPSLHLRSFDD